MKLETIATVYDSRDRSSFQELQQPYTVNWAAELGRGTYGKVYVGTKEPATGLQRDEGRRGFAIKMLRDQDADASKTSSKDAIFAADWYGRILMAKPLRPSSPCKPVAGSFVPTYTLP